MTLAWRHRKRRRQSYNLFNNPIYSFLLYTRINNHIKDYMYTETYVPKQLNTINNVFDMFYYSCIQENESTHIVGNVCLFPAAKTAIRTGENLCKINAPAGMQKRHLQEAARAPSSSAARVPQVR